MGKKGLRKISFWAPAPKNLVSIPDEGYVGVFGGTVSLLEISPPNRLIISIFEGGEQITTYIYPLKGVVIITIYSPF